MIKECFQQEIQRLSDFCAEHKFDLAFMLAADSHLDDYEEDTILNMQAADSLVSYDFLVHLGDFMTGNMPKGYTAKVLKQEMGQYRSAVKNGVFYPVQGNHDGYCVSSFTGSRCDIVVDEDWYEATDFTREYRNVTREEKSAYYYADYPEKKLRLVFLCSFSYEWTDEGKYCKKYRMSEKQLQWLGSEALAVDAEWTVMIFSHDGPLKYFDQARLDEEPWEGNKKQLLDIVLQAKTERGFTIAGWFIGHWHGELCEYVEGIPFIIIGSQTYYVPSLWPMPDKGHYEPREVGTVSQDLWDSVTWNKADRTLHLFRFGAGEDRVVTY